MKAPPRSLTAGAGAGFKEVVTDVRGRQELARVVKWHARLLQGVVILWNWTRRLDFASARNCENAPFMVIGTDFLRRHVQCTCHRYIVPVIECLHPASILASLSLDACRHASLPAAGWRGILRAMITAHLSAARWLWTSELADRATGHVCNAFPLRAARYEGSGLNLVAVHELDIEAGTLLVSTPAGMSSRGCGPWGGSHAVHRLGADGSLANVLMDAAADELDPAGAEARLHRRLALAAGLSLETVRFRMREGHGYETGTAVQWSTYWAIIERATARQVWARAPSHEEMTAAGLPIVRSDTPEAQAAAARIWGP